MKYEARIKLETEGTLEGYYTVQQWLDDGITLLTLSVADPTKIDSLCSAVNDVYKGVYKRDSKEGIGP